MPIADSQATLWHRGNSRYRCFLPDLTGFAGPPCTGPGYQQSASNPTLRAYMKPYDDPA
jgi:hypothetical protein